MKCHVFLPELDGYVSPVAPIPFNCIGTESKWKINCYCKYLIGRESVKKKKKASKNLHLAHSKKFWKKWIKFWNDTDNIALSNDYILCTST